MDENKKNDQLQENPTKILTDEAAIAGAGLTDPSDADMERLLEEARDLSATDSIPTETFRDQEFTDTFGSGEALEKVFSDEPCEAPQEPEQAEEPAEPERKGRPERKKGYGLLGIPHILATGLWLVLVVAIGVSLGRVAWICVADVLAFGREDKQIVFTVEDSDTLADISENLRDAGLIRYPQLFQLYGVLSDAREDISSGTFTLNTLYDYHALVNSMNYYSSDREEVTVMIPEGYTCKQMFELLEEKGVCTVKELEEYAANGELDDYWFLEGVERGTPYCLEGFLFPDTYDFYKDDKPERVLEKMLDDFDYRFGEGMIAAMDTLNEQLANILRNRGFSEEAIAENRMELYDVVIVASLIEKETANNDESYNIASVIYNRLYDWGDTPRYLNIDAALLYALGHKEALTTEDLQTDTPYNTYLYTGLVPTPICNPGLNSLNAALNPNDTDYYFYVLDPDSGTHIFSQTNSGHINAGG